MISSGKTNRNEEREGNKQDESKAAILLLVEGACLAHELCPHGQ